MLGLLKYLTFILPEPPLSAEHTLCETLWSSNVFLPVMMALQLHCCNYNHDNQHLPNHMLTCRFNKNVNVLPNHKLQL